jgi:RimJ/RimL family protein N-acetyltransferase
MNDIRGPRLVLRLLPLPAIRATIAGDLAAVAHAAALDIPAAWLEAADLAAMRLDQLTANPHYAPWSLRAMALADTGEMVGYINCHDAPLNGTIELGYEVFARHRGRGYATEAVHVLLAWAHGQGVRRAVFSVSPDNAASRAIVHRLGATRIGSQTDAIDGLEDVYQMLIEPDRLRHRSIAG